MNDNNLTEKFGPPPIPTPVILLGQTVVCLIALFLIEPPFVQHDRNLSITRLVTVLSLTILSTCMLHISGVHPVDAFRGTVELTHRAFVLDNCVRS